MSYHVDYDDGRPRGASMPVYFATGCLMTSGAAIPAHCVRVDRQATIGEFDGCSLADFQTALDRRWELFQRLTDRSESCLNRQAVTSKSK